MRVSSFMTGTSVFAALPWFFSEIEAVSALVSIVISEGASEVSGEGGRDSADSADSLNPVSGALCIWLFSAGSAVSVSASSMEEAAPVRTGGIFS